MKLMDHPRRKKRATNYHHVPVSLGCHPSVLASPVDRKLVTAIYMVVDRKLVEIASSNHRLGHRLQTPRLNLPVSVQVRLTTLVRTRLQPIYIPLPTKKQNLTGRLYRAVLTRCITKASLAPILGCRCRHPLTNS